MSWSVNSCMCAMRNPFVWYSGAGISCGRSSGRSLKWLGIATIWLGIPSPGSELMMIFGRPVEPLDAMPCAGLGTTSGNGDASRSTVAAELGTRHHGHRPVAGVVADHEHDPGRLEQSVPLPRGHVPPHRDHARTRPSTRRGGEEVIDRVRERDGDHRAEPRAASREQARHLRRACVELPPRHARRRRRRSARTPSATASGCSSASSVMRRPKETDCSTSVAVTRVKVTSRP